MENKTEKQFLEEFVKIVVDSHNAVIIESGGESGIRDEGGLYNSCYKIISFSRKHNKSPFLTAAFIYSEFAKRHYFVDGNKRTAHVLAKAFLILEGYHFLTPYKTAVNFIINIAKDNISINKTKKWLEENSIEIDKTDIKLYIKRTIEELHDTYDRKRKK